MFVGLKEKYYQSRILYPAKLSFKAKGGMKTFLSNQKLRKFVASGPALQKKCLRASFRKKERKKGSRQLPYQNKNTSKVGKYKIFISFSIWFKKLMHKIIINLSK
jgi:hypothetical protein